MLFFLSNILVIFKVCLSLKYPCPPCYFFLCVVWRLFVVIFTHFHLSFHIHTLSQCEFMYLLHSFTAYLTFKHPSHISVWLMPWKWPWILIWTWTGKAKAVSWCLFYFCAQLPQFSVGQFPDFTYNLSNFNGSKRQNLDYETVLKLDGVGWCCKAITLQWGRQVWQPFASRKYWITTFGWR